MVALMLDAASHELLPLDDDLLAVQVHPLGPGVPGSLRGEPQPRNRQAAFIPILVLVLGYLDDLGVEDVADLAVDVPGEGAQTDPDLIGGQAGPAVLIDRLEQVLNQGLDGVVDVSDPVALGAQDRVADDADVAVCHGGILP